MGGESYERVCLATRLTIKFYYMKDVYEFMQTEDNCQGDLECTEIKVT